MYDFLSYRRPTTDDAKLLLDWRTAPHIARFMLTEVPYDIERQKTWIERCNARDDYQHAIIRIEGKDVGYASITVVDPRNGIGELGVYMGDPDAPKALSVYNFIGTHNHAFLTMGLHKIVNHVIDFNGRVVRMQAFNGYRHVGVLKDHVLKDGGRYDLHIFEQQAAEWAQFRKKFDDTRNWDGVETVYRG